MNRGTSSQQAVRFALVAALLVLVGGAVSYEYNETLLSHAQGPNGRVTHVESATNIDLWRINEPNVKQRITPYPEIRFQPGDVITIDAGGCVQTGGHGDTWKRYVNPSGDDSDH